MADRKDFCDACFSLLFEQPPEGSDKHHLSGQELKTCAESKSCNLCANLWSRCSDIQQKDICESSASSNQNVSGDEENYLRCSYRDKQLVFTLPIYSETKIQHYGSDRPQQVELIFDTTIPGFRSMTDRQRKKIADKTFTEETARLAKRWIEGCISGHDHSKLAPICELLPTRLIEVGTVSNPVLRVFETSSAPNKMPYVTLSHRWIEGKVARLLKSNLQEYSQAIMPDILSNNFKDAINITRLLDVGYIWIDSLCIVQDSAEDWTTESARMADYYEYSYCTLSATASTEHDAGLIFDRNPNVVLPTFYDLRPPVAPGKKEESMFKKTLNLGASVIKKQEKPENHLLPPGKYVLVDPRPWYREVDPSPLNSRAWCYQERLLSSRVLHFCKTRIFFECLNQKCSEEAPHGIQKDIFVQDYKDISPQSCILKMRKHDKDEFAKATHAMWATIVAQYSSRQLTFAKDRLVALAGVAQRFQEMMTHQRRSDHPSRRIACHREGQKLPDYFMGIWLCNELTVGDLCWSTAANFESRPKKLHGLVPTWSFGSVTSQVHFGTAQVSGPILDVATELARIVKVDVDFKTVNDSEDAFNTAMWTCLINPGTGAIWLEGSLLPVGLSTTVIEAAKSADDPRRLLIEAGTWADHPLLVINGEVQRWGWQADELRSGSSSDNHGWSGQYFLMGLCGMPGENRLCGVVLECVDRGDGCYKRVGSVCLGPPEFDNAVDYFTEHLDNENIDPRFYEAKLDDGRLRVKII
ncbi:HET-domain-containing protein [Xylariaceae sp. FL0255]|nr:HET-domain-containing protein [Xylariaceae sp. FL0255]